MQWQTRYASKYKPIVIVHQLFFIPLKASGKGWETKNYENIDFSFKGIENIHKMRGSLKQLITSISSGLATTSMDSFMTELANSGWLKHVKAVLDTSLSVVNNILEGKLLY